MAAPIELKKINEFVSGLTALTNIAGSFVYGIDSNGNSIKISTALFAAQVTTQQFNEVVTKCNNNGTLIAALQIAVNGKSDTGHTHTLSDVEGLQDALDGKSDTGHKHAISDVNGLESRLSDIENTTAEIDGYGRRITAAETNIRQNSVDLQGQNTRITALETATNGYSSAIQTNTSNIATLTTTVNGMSNSISGKADQADLDNVENQISSLSTTVGEKAAQTEMDALDLRVVNLENGTTGGAMVQADLSQMENPTVNMIAQHTGATSGNLVNGYIYKYKSNGTELVVNVTARKKDFYSDENIPVGAYRFTGVTTETSVDIADGNGASTQTVYQLQDENDNLYWCLDSSETIVGKRQTGIKIDHTADSGTPTAGVVLWITDVPVYLTTTETYSWIQTDVQPSIAISYDSTAKKILVKNVQNVVLSEIDCTDFIKDGMVSNAAYNSTTHKLTISFNTDSGNQPIEVDLSDLVDVADGSNVELSENYEKASTYTEPAAGDSVDEAIGKLTKGVQDATSNTSESIKILQDLAKKVGVSKNMSVVIYKGGSLFSHNEGYYNRNIAEAVISATGEVITINTSYDTTGAAGNQKICIVKELNSDNYHFLPNDSTKIGTQYTLVYDYDEYAQLADLVGSQDDAYLNYLKEYCTVASLDAVIVAGKRTVPQCSYQTNNVFAYIKDENKIVKVSIYKTNASISPLVKATSGSTTSYFIGGYPSSTYTAIATYICDTLENIANSVAGDEPRAVTGQAVSIYTSNAVNSGINNFYANNISYYYNANTPHDRSGNREAAIAYVLNHLQFGETGNKFAIIRFENGFPFGYFISKYNNHCLIVSFSHNTKELQFYDASFSNGSWGSVTLQKTF